MNTHSTEKGLKQGYRGRNLGSTGTRSGWIACRGWVVGLVNHRPKPFNWRKHLQNGCLSSPQNRPDVRGNREGRNYARIPTRLSVVVTAVKERLLRRERTESVLFVEPQALEPNQQTTHVEVRHNGIQDAGSIPAASIFSKKFLENEELKQYNIF